MKRSGWVSWVVIGSGVAAFAAGIWIALHLPGLDTDDRSGVVIVAAQPGLVQSQTDAAQPEAAHDPADAQQEPAQHSLVPKAAPPAPQPQWQPVQQPVVPYYGDDDDWDDDWDDWDDD